MDVAATLKNSNVWKNFEALRSQIDAPQGVMSYRMVEEIIELRRQTEKVKWAARAAVFGILVILVFGFKVVFY